MYLPLDKKYSKDYVIAVQKKLSELGFYDGVIDGVYGHKTFSAVLRFQRMNGLVDDGDAGHQTWSLLFPSQRPDVRTVQSTSRDHFPHEDSRSLMRFYGDPARDIERVIKSYKTPYPLYFGGTKVNSIRLHPKCADAFLELFELVSHEYDSLSIRHLGLNKYGGSYNKRKMRGGSHWSTHSYGAAIDLFPERNQLRWNHTKAAFARPEYDKFFEFVDRVGLYSLGKHKDYDWMHIQACYR